jgi:CubicO group peptidase (beta-lactamase class C family)
MFRIIFSILLLSGGPVSAVDATGFREAAQYSAVHQGKSLLVIQHGKTIFQSYANGGTAHEPLKIYSGTKGFWIVAALAAEEDGILRLDDKVADTLREWREDGRKAQLTIRDLLTFTSGLDPVFHLHSDEVPDRNTVALAAPIVAPPGERFIYGPAALQVFDELLRRKLAGRRDNPTHYLERRVLAPLGLGPQVYKKDRAGHPLLASGFRLTADQWARMGRLILNGGVPVLSSRSLAQCLHGTAANPAFGMGFWNNRAAASGAREFDIEDMLDLDWSKQDWRDTCICRDAPADLVAAIGSGYQRLFVIPSMDLIVVRQGTGGRFSDPEFLRLLLGR